MITEDDISIETRSDESQAATLARASVTVELGMLVTDSSNHMPRGFIGASHTDQLKSELLQSIYREKDDAISCLRSALESCLKWVQCDEKSHGREFGCGCEGRAALEMTKNSGASS